MLKEWWRGCIIYQIYPRSFYDTSNTGVGDLNGITKKLEYISSLGVDAIWICPFFKSPMKDFGYDVSNHIEVDPEFGELKDFKALLAKAKELKIKVIIDQVWSHTSDEHEWFKQSRIDNTNDKEDWYIWADPKPDGSPPNNWISYFGGPAWTWDENRKKYYLHHFLKEQPNLNFWNPTVRQKIKDIASFWLDLGVDGFRIDAAHTYLCDKDLRDNPPRPIGEKAKSSDIPPSNPMSSQQRIHSMCLPDNLEWLSEIRAHINQWTDKCLLAEAGGDNSEDTAASYVQTKYRLNLAYSFGLVGSHMHKEDVTKSIQSIEAVLEDGWICWSTGNHDFKRAITRVNPDKKNTYDIAKYVMALGLTLRGSFCIYQGEELGLEQADLKLEDLIDPYDIMLYPEHTGRDGCRTPMPWNSTLRHSGFSKANGKTWLPIPDNHKRKSANLQEQDDKSILNEYRKFIKWRKNTKAIVTGDINLIESPKSIIAYERTSKESKTVFCIFNSSDNKKKWTIPTKYTQYKYISDISHNSIKNKDIIELRPYGYAFLIKD